MFSIAKISSAFLLMVLTCSGPVVPELIKLPRLIAHFHQHNAAENISLADFLIAHYAHEHGNDSDAAEDRELPFLSGNVASFGPCSVPQSPFISPGSFPIVTTDLKGGNSHLFTDPHLSMIWQPPRCG